MKRLFLCLGLTLANTALHGQGDQPGGASDVPAVPDLTVASASVRVDWVRAHAEDDRFTRLLTADLHRIGEETGKESLR